jgi:hypothetical protein
MNFGETFAYWYLRLNGFFPLSNFVLHGSEEALRHSADVDLLAVRFPHVFEVIGGQERDWDTWFQQNLVDFEANPVGLLVEVKTGASASLPDMRRAFKQDRLRAAIHRLGFWPPDECEGVVNLLTERSYARGDGYTVAKLAITTRLLPSERVKDVCLNRSLSEIESFIHNRMQAYADPKLRDRMFFPDDLIQYFAWKATSG